MALTVESARDLFVFWQGKLEYGTEVKGACPFCSPLSVDGAPVFEGDNRFHWWRDMLGGFCRVCEEKNRGDVGSRPGYWRLETVARRFGATVAGNFDKTSPVIEEKPLTGLWVEGEVAEAHAKVDYAWWWEEYRWPKDLVDRFKLGMGNLYPSRWHYDRHLVPMKNLARYGEAPIQYYYIASRFRTADGQKLKERTPGTSKPYLWFIEEDQESREIALVEGDTDGITAAYLGFANIAATFGSTTWTTQKAQLLKERGYERVIILADGDSAGQALAQQQAETCLRAGIEDVWLLDWGQDERDISALYKDLGDAGAARAWIDQRLIKPTERVQQRLNPYRNPNNEHELVTIEALRGDGEQSLRHQIDAYLASYEHLYKRGRGVALHLQAPPGAGKTHILIETAERIAKASLEANALAKEELITAIAEQKRLQIENPEQAAVFQEMIEKLEKKLVNWSQTAVAWYGLFKNGAEDLELTGADTSLWYDYEARNEHNCQNLSRVNELGSKNHDIGLFCKTACAFYRMCEQEGYWKQEQERRTKPITFFRHQHLMANHEQDYKALVVVDEYAGHILESDPITFEPKHIYPSVDGWEMDVVSGDVVQATKDFAAALRATLASNAGALVDSPEYIVSGAKFIGRLDQQCRSLTGQDLESLLSRLDRSVLHQVYQPHFKGGVDDTVHLRCLPQTYDVLCREILDYLEFPENEFPSCLHLVAGQLEVYAAGTVKNRQKTPMIVADATGMPSLYQAMFNREVQVFSPAIRNPNAHIEVVRGSDFTKGVISRQLGAALRDRKKVMAGQDTVTTLTGKTFDPEEVPVSEDLYEAQVLREAMSIAQTLAERHKSLLVVTHKDLKELMESLAQATWPNDERQELLPQVAFGHYGALRGTNKYEDFEAVVLIGVFRIPYNIVWRRISMWSWLLGIKEAIKPDIIKVEDGFGGQYPTFEHQFADAFVGMLEEGELQQTAARIRPHSSHERKFVYCFANRPAMQFVNKISQKTEFLRGGAGHKHAPAYRYILDALQSGKPMPSLSILRQELKISNASIRKIEKQIRMELNLK